MSVRAVRPSRLEVYQDAFCDFETIEVRYVESGDGRRVEVFESGRGEPILLLPGYSLASIWRNQLVHLAKTHRVLALNYPGAGQSDPHPHCTSLNALADAIASVVHALKLPVAPHIIGWSMGGFVAMELADRHSDTVRSMTVVNGAAYLDRREVAFADLAVDFMQNWAARRSHLGAFNYEHIKDSVGLQPMREQYEHIVDLRASLRRIRVPTTVISGRKDKVAPRDAGPQAAAGIAGAEHHWLEGAGHFIPLFHEQGLHRILERHLAQ
jgi:pimeloyl-ACP methyl ester carboxylesterase